MSCTNIDWSTFTFIAGTGQTLVNATTLTSTNSTASGVTFDPATRVITYEFDTANCIVDVVQFTVEDEDGNISNVGVWYIDTEDLTAPVAVNDSSTLAAGASSSVNAISNDTGNINPSSYEVVTAPTKVTLTNNLDGTFTIAAPADEEGSDSFTYKFQSPDGLSSNTATVNITIQNAGTGTSGTICGTSGIDITSYLDGSVTAGGSWAADAGNPSSPSLAVPTAVDFSAATAGTYLFTYTIGSSSATITLELPDYSVTIDSVSTPTSNPIASSITSVVEFTTIGVSNANNIQLEVDVKGGTSYDYYPPDTWNASTGKGTITIEYADGAGTYDLTITATDDCGDAQTDTWATITIVP